MRKTMNFWRRLFSESLLASLGHILIVVGLQDGDEGKGKTISYLARFYRYLFRFNGAANAGYGLGINGSRFILNSVPAGIVHRSVTNIIAPGSILDPEIIILEIGKLKAMGLMVDDHQLLISEQTPLVLPVHKLMDGLRDSVRSQKLITTKRGVGPAYEDKELTLSILFGDLYHPETLDQKIDDLLLEKNSLLTNLYHQSPIDPLILKHKLLIWAEELKNYRLERVEKKNVSELVNEAIDGRMPIIFQGVQGTSLDITFGQYPYVTSSNTLAAAACTSAGFGPQLVDGVLGVFKPYVTKIGAGPMITELKDDFATHVQSVGQEFGSITGNQRRCGALDLVALERSIKLNGVTALALMKLDVLSGLEKIPVAEKYLFQGERLRNYPTAEMIFGIKPKYWFYNGWSDNIQGCQKFSKLPKNARIFITNLEDFIERPIKIIGTGPGQDDIIIRN